MKKTRLFILALVVQLIVTIGLGTAISYSFTHDRAQDGFIVWGEDVSGQNRTQISLELRGKIPSAVSFQGQVYPLKLERTYLDIEEWLDRAFPVATGNMLLDAFHNLARPSMKISSNELGLNRVEIVNQLQELSQNINISAQPAKITYTDGKLLKSEAEIGLEVDVEKTWLKLVNEHEKSVIDIVVNNVTAQPSTAEISKVQDILGDYTTYYNSEDIPRTKNLSLAADAINNQLIAPGEVFSFNDVVGERTQDAGYQPAFVFENDSVVKGLGGGICQDSSTLFRAVSQANLIIEERHTHSLTVSYVLKGQDATVAYGMLDFRFRNDTQGYLLISARTGSNWLRVQLFGLADEKHPVLLSRDGYPARPEEWTKDNK